MNLRIVIDTNIIISALKSRNGAANKLLSIIDEDKYISCISVPLVFEHEEVIKRMFPQMPQEDLDGLLDFICKV